MSHCLLVGWFCPWAQRAWLAREHLGVQSVRVVNSAESVLLDTDISGSAASEAKFMIKGAMLGSASVPAMFTVATSDILEQKDFHSIELCKWLLEHQLEAEGGAPPFDCSQRAMSEAAEWSDALCSNPFYGALMNREGKADEFYSLWLGNLKRFGDKIQQPFYYGDTISVLICFFSP